MIDIPSFADLNLGVAAPAIFLSLYTTVLLIVDVLFVPKEQKIRTAHLALLGLVIAFVLNLFTFDSGELALGGLFQADEFTGFLTVVVLGTAVITVLLSVDYLKRIQSEQGEYYSMLLFSVTGMMLMASGNSLIVLFIALELLSIPLYVMAAIRHRDPKS